MLKFKFGRKNRQPISYVDAHNNAVTKYRRACKAFIWVGVVNFVGLLIGVIQYYAQGSAETVPFYYCFGLCDFLFNLLARVQGLHVALFWAIVGVITTATTVGAVLLGLFSAQGKKVLLFTIAGIYLADWIFALLAFFVVTNDTIGLMIDAGIHVVASFFIILAIFEYYNVINIEKTYNKQKSESKEENSEVQENEHQS